MQVRFEVIEVGVVVRVLVTALVMYLGLKWWLKCLLGTGGLRKDLGRTIRPSWRGL